MTEYSTDQAALRAKAELELTNKAFSELGVRYLREILAAKSPEEAWQGVLAMRALDSVTQSLKGLVETKGLDDHYRELEENG